MMHADAIKPSVLSVGLTWIRRCCWAAVRMVCTTGKKAVFILLVAALVALLFAFNINEMLPDYLREEHAQLINKYLPMAMFALSAYWGSRGLLGLVDRREIEIDGKTVSVSAPFRLWGRKWTEPLSNYQGVRWNRYAIHGNRDCADSVKIRHRHVISLVHPKPSRTVPLFVSKTGRARITDALNLVQKAVSASSADDPGLQAQAERLAEQAQAGNPRARWESLAATLGLPAIDARDGAYEVRDTEDLDKSIQTLSDEGKVRPDWQDASPPPSLAVERGGDPDDGASRELRVTIHATHHPTDAACTAVRGLDVRVITEARHLRADDWSQQNRDEEYDQHGRDQRQDVMTDTLASRYREVDGDDASGDRTGDDAQKRHPDGGPEADNVRAAAEQADDIAEHGSQNDQRTSQQECSLLPVVGLRKVGAPGRPGVQQCALDQRESAVQIEHG